MKAPWSTLDLEENALRQDRYAGVGHQTYEELGLDDANTTTEDRSSAYHHGGKVDFILRLEEAPNNTFSISVDKATRAQSNKIKRRFGSTSLLRCKVPDKLINRKGQQVIQFFERPIVIFCCVFRAFYAKDDSVFLFKTNEVFCNGHVKVDPTSQAWSLLTFLDWVNSLEWNQGQVRTHSKLMTMKPFL